MVLDKFEGKVDEATSLTVRDRIVYCDANAASAGFTVTLPNVSEARGMIFIIYAETDASSNNITVSDNSDSMGWSDITLDAADEYTLLMSDGRKWFEIASNHA